MFNFLILGAGPFVGTFVWSELQAYYTVDEQVQYNHLFLYPAGTALVAAILLALFFHPPRTVDVPAHAEDEGYEAPAP